MTNKIHSDVITIGDKQDVHNQMAKWSYTQIENVDVDVRGFLISNRGKLFATNEVQLTDNTIDIFLAFVGHMSCSADTYVSLGASNGCADQLTNWDGIQKLGLGAPSKRSHKIYPGNDNERRFIVISTTNHLKLQKCDA